MTVRPGKRKTKANSDKLVLQVQVKSISRVLKICLQKKFVCFFYRLKSIISNLLISGNRKITKMVFILVNSENILNDLFCQYIFCTLFFNLIVENPVKRQWKRKWRWGGKSLMHLNSRKKTFDNELHSQVNQFLKVSALNLI